MKNMSILYGIAIIAVIGIVVCSVSSSIVPALMDTPQQSAYTTVTSTQAITSCASCDEKDKRMREMMRQWLNEKAQEHPSNKKMSVKGSDTEQTQVVR